MRLALAVARTPHTRNEYSGFPAVLAILPVSPPNLLIWIQPASARAFSLLRPISQAIRISFDDSDRHNMSEGETQTG